MLSAKKTNANLYFIKSFKFNFMWNDEEINVNFYFNKSFLIYQSRDFTFFFKNFLFLLFKLYISSFLSCNLII